MERDPRLGDTLNTLKQRPDQPKQSESFPLSTEAREDELSAVAVRSGDRD